MSAPRDADVVRAYIEAEGNRDVEAMRSLVADDLVFEAPYARNGGLSRMEGGDAVIAHVGSVITPEAGRFGEWEFYDIEVYSTDRPGVVLTEWKSRGTIAKTGKPYENIYVGYFEVADGRIRVQREYYDGERIARAFAD